MNKVHQLQEELRARDEVIGGLRAGIGERYTLETENRLQKAELKTLKDGIQHMLQHDKRLQHKFAVISAALPKIDEDDVIPGDNDDVVAVIRALAPHSGKNYVVTQPVELLADILSFLDRFSLDRAAFSCSKLRTAVASLGPQNLRDLSSVRLEVTGPDCDEWGRRPHGNGLQRGRRGRARPGLSATHKRYLNPMEKNTFTISVEYFLDPKALKNGATRATGKLEWGFVDNPMATSHFVGLLRNASVRQFSLTGPSSHQFIQALSAAKQEEAAKSCVAVRSLTIDRFVSEAAYLETEPDALMSFTCLEKLIINDVSLTFLSDQFLLSAMQKRVTSITLTSRRFSLRSVGGWNWNATWQIEAALGSERNYPELCDGLLSFLFRDDLDGNAEIVLNFPAARVPQDFGLKLMKSAKSAKTAYSIRASFVAVTDVSEYLVGYEEYRLDNGDDNCVVYEIPRLSEADVTVVLKIIKITAVNISEEPGPSPTSWKLVEFRRYRESDEKAQY